MPQPKAWRKSIKLPVKSAFQILSNVPLLPMIYGISGESAFARRRQYMFMNLLQSEN
jgi:hypothetical protein